MKTRVTQKSISKNIAFFNDQMHRVLFPLLFLIILAFTATGQTKVWDRTYGGVITEYPIINAYYNEYIKYGSSSLSTMIRTPDGGYLLGGSSDSETGNDKSQKSRDANDYEYFEYDDGPFYNDYWVVKTDSSGNKVWDKTFGGGAGDELTAIVATPDGGYLLGGWSDSGRGGDKSEEQRPGYYCLDWLGPVDYWIVKIDGSGNKLWDKVFGGDGYDYLNAIVATPDGGFILAGHSGSGISGDKSEDLYGYYCEDNDYWIIKIDGSGNKLWDKTFGGDGYDYLKAIVATPDGGYLLGGISYSGVNGDKSEGSRGGSDYWAVKIDGSGNKVWDKTFGGSDYEFFSAIAATPDGGYLLGGTSYSEVSGDKSAMSLGGSDYWIVKIDGSGNKLWDKAFGGSKGDGLRAIADAPGGGYLLGGTSSSEISVDKSEASRGSSDYWAVKIDGSGSVLWDKTLGGSESDGLAAIVATSEGDFVLAGTSYSGISGDKSEVKKSFGDYWVVKVRDEETVLPPVFASFSPNKGLPGTTVTLKGAHLLTTSSVSFNGAEAEFTVASDSVLRVVVPAAAAAGRITITTDGGEVTSGRHFRVLQPSIFVFVPWWGYVGSAVYLVGEHLTTTSEVRFNGVPATGLTVYNDHLLQVTVPEGATTGRITMLLAGGGQVVSSFSYTVIRSIKKMEKEAGVLAATAAEPVIAYPNPFTEEVTISVGLPEAEGPVSFVIYSASGQKVRELNFGKLGEGRHELKWDGTDSHGKAVARGLYFYQVTANRKIASGKLLKER